MSQNITHAAFAAVATSPAGNDVESDAESSFQLTARVLGDPAPAHRGRPGPVDILPLGTPGDDNDPGTPGNDTLNGDAGNDTLDGGAGVDVFRFSSALNASTNVDTLRDFNVIDDKLELENSIFTKLTTTGALSSSNFRASTSGNAADSNDYVLYETDTGSLFYDADGSAAGAKVLIAKLTNLAGLTSADIFVT